MAPRNEKPPKSKLSVPEAEVALVREFWQRGDLQYKLKAAQTEMWRRITDSPRFMYIIKCSRRLGKSYLLVSRGTSTCRRKERGMVRYAAPTAKAVRKIVRPLLEIITADCPEYLKPKWKALDGMWVFPETDGEFHVAGVNNGNADDLRGTFTDDFLIDEGGTIDDLHYLVHDVAMPQLLDRDMRIVEGRRLIIASSPPRSPAHQFTQMANVAEVEGNYSHYDIFDGDYPIEIIKRFLKEDGVSEHDVDALLEGDYEAILSTTVKREYLALDVVDENYALCPEWSETYEQEFELDEFYKFYHKYESLDIGVRHHSVDIFGHWDFKQAKLFIHDEAWWTGPKMTTEVVADGIRAKETALWGIKWESFIKDNRVRWKATLPHDKFTLKRKSDINLLLIQDLTQLHNLYFDATDKGELEQMVNEVRVWVKNGKIIVHPRCKQLLGCLKYGVWNENRTDFDTSDAYGHFDAFASLMYMVRNIDQKTNPIPFDYNKPEIDHWLDDAEKAKRKDKLRQMFNVHRRR